MNIQPSLVAVTCLVIASPAIAATTYKFKETTGANGASLIYEDINNKNAILVQSTSSTGTVTCTVQKGTKSTTIADPNGQSTSCLGIDTAGDVVGYYVPTSNPNEIVGFTYAGGKYTDFVAKGAGSTGGQGTELDAISADGKTIAGSYIDSKNHIQIFLLVGGKQTDVPISGQKYVIAVGVNNSAAITAQTFDSSHTLTGGVLVQGKTITPISFPGAGAGMTRVHQINTAGVVVANEIDSSGIEHGFTYDSVAKTYSAPIDAPKATATALLGINDAGVLCGFALNTAGIKLGLVATPKK